MIRVLHILGAIAFWVLGVLVLGWVLGTFGDFIRVGKHHREDGE